MAEQILRYTAQLAANDQLPNLGEVAAGIALTIPAFRFARKKEWGVKVASVEDELKRLENVSLPAPLPDTTNSMLGFIEGIDDMLQAGERVLVALGSKKDNVSALNIGDTIAVFNESEMGVEIIIDTKSPEEGNRDLRQVSVVRTFPYGRVQFKEGVYTDFSGKGKGTSYDGVFYNRAEVMIGRKPDITNGLGDRMTVDRATEIITPVISSFRQFAIDLRSSKPPRISLRR